MKILTMVFLGTLWWASATVAQGTEGASAATVAAQTAATSWLRLVDESHYAASWDSAGAAFQAAVTKPEWESAVVQARGPFEPFGSRKLVSVTFTTTLPKAPPGEYVVLQYETEVSGGRAVVETITPTRDAGGVWRVSGYFVRPR